MTIDWAAIKLFLASGKAISAFIDLLVFFFVLVGGKISITWMRRRFWDDSK